MGQTLPLPTRQLYTGRARGSDKAVKENKMNVRIMIAAMAAVTVLSLPMVASAQRWPTTRGNDQYRRNGNYNNYNRNLVDRVVKAERASNEFREEFERMWSRNNDRDRDWNNGWNREWSRNGSNNGRWGTGNNNGRYGNGNNRYYGSSNPKEAVQRFDEAMERLRSAVNRNSRDNYGARDEMDEVLARAREVDRFFGSSIWSAYGRGNGRYNGRSDNRVYSGRLDNQWSQLRRDIDSLARDFGRGW